MANTERIFRVALYCRLSKDDGVECESGSISTQKDILTQFVRDKGWHVVKTYVDDGYTGTNFDRPGFQEMIKAIKDGQIDCVITKDLSRLGRNYLDCGIYLEVFFPEHGVRYIAVNDSVDTLNNSAMDITPFKNILNEMYSKDQSVKTKTALRSRFSQGKFTGTSAPYGYLKDPSDHNRLIVDEKAAPIVRKMFELAKGGWGISRIRRYLTDQRLMRPAAMAIENGVNYDRCFEANPERKYFWSENSVRQVLRSPTYAGHLTAYKRPCVSMKIKKRPSRLPEEWEIIKNTHEAIVSQEDFDLVQRLMTCRRDKKNISGYDNVFAGIVKCSDCGYALRSVVAHRTKSQFPIENIDYYCANYMRYGTDVCTKHRLSARQLHQIVLDDINQFARMAQDDEKMIRKIQKQLSDSTASEYKDKEREHRKMKKRLAELDKLFAALYEDKVMKKITERNYELMSKRYELEQLELEKQITEIGAIITSKEENDQNAYDFVKLMKQFVGLKELSAAMVNTLIDRITVGESKPDKDGNKVQEIKIYYRFVGHIGYEA